AAAGGVVAPVLQLAQPADEQRRRLTRAGVADDAAHRGYFFSAAAGSVVAASLGSGSSTPVISLMSGAFHSTAAVSTRTLPCAPQPATAITIAIFQTCLMSADASIFPSLVRRGEA